MFVAAYAGMAAILFHVGAGYGVPTQLVLVPMLLLAPVDLVPALVAAGLVLSTAPAVLRRRERPQRLVSAVGDGWYAFGPAAVLAAGGEPGPALAHLPLFAAAFVAQAVGEAVVAVAREWVTRGICPRDQVGVLGMVQAVDLLLWPIGLLAAMAGARIQFAWVLVVPQGVLLGLLARDRATQITVAQDRLSALRRERSRFIAAVRRVGAAFASTLDRDALLAITLETAMEAVHARAAAMADGSAWRVVGDHATPELGRALIAAAERARGGAGVVVDRCDELSIVACAVRAHLDGDAVGAVALARPEPFVAEEQELVASLAQQAAVSVENVELHARLHEQASTDGLTGLANHRTLHEHAQREFERARRAGGQLAVLLVDVDDFKDINDTYGHVEGDRAIRHVGEILRGSCRVGDHPARYGGEEFALILPGAEPQLAMRVAERVRVAVARAPVTTAGGGAMQLTVSIGVACLHNGDRQAASLIAAADECLYRAKRSGKNQVVVR